MKFCYTFYVKNKTLFLLVLIVVGFSLVIIYLKSNRTSKPTTEQMPAAENLTKIYGSIRKYKLDDITWSESMGLALEGFVLDHINSNGLLEDFVPIESTSKQNLDSFINKCVELTGTVKTNENIDGYGKTKLMLESVRLTNYSNCTPYWGGERPPEIKTQTITGVLKRIDRVYPDITYDYTVKLAEPFLDEFSASGIPTMKYEAITSPNSNKIWEQFEQVMGQKVIVEGYWTWGYAESRYFVAENISLVK